MNFWPYFASRSGALQRTARVVLCLASFCYLSSWESPESKGVGFAGNLVFFLSSISASWTPSMMTKENASIDIFWMFVRDPFFDTALPSYGSWFLLATDHRRWIYPPYFLLFLPIIWALVRIFWITSILKDKILWCSSRSTRLRCVGTVNWIKSKSIWQSHPNQPPKFTANCRKW